MSTWLRLTYKVFFHPFLQEFWIALQLWVEPIQGLVHYNGSGPAREKIDTTSKFIKWTEQVRKNDCLTKNMLLIDWLILILDFCPFLSDSPAVRQHGSSRRSSPSPDSAQSFPTWNNEELTCTGTIYCTIFMTIKWGLSCFSYLCELFSKFIQHSKGCCISNTYFRPAGLLWTYPALLLLPG